MFLLSSFLFWFDDFHLLYASVLFFLGFVNVMFGFDLWLPCFLTMLTPSCTCRLKHIIYLKKKKESIFSYFLSPHSMISKFFFNIVMFVPLLFLVLIIVLHGRVFLFVFVCLFSFFQICVLAYLSDCFPVVVSPILCLLLSF